MSIDLRRRSTRFGSWIAGYGVRRLAGELSGAGYGVTSQAVYEWLAGRTTPRLPLAVELSRLSCGAVSIEDIRAHRVQVAFRMGKA